MRIGFVFQFFHLLPSLTALENILVPMEIAAFPVRGRGRRRSSTRSGCQTGIPQTGSFRAVSSSAWRSRGRSPTTRRCCWPTSPPETTARPATSYRAAARRESFARHLVLVTHDPELAAVADMSIALSWRTGVAMRAGFPRPTCRLPRPSCRIPDPHPGPRRPGLRGLHANPAPRIPIPTRRPPRPSCDSTPESGSRRVRLCIPSGSCARRGGVCCSSSSASRSAWPPSWQIIQSLRTGLVQARATIAADVLVQSSRP